MGEFKDGRKEGKGVYYFSEGTVFEGTWHNDFKVEGELTLFNGDSFLGIFRNNERFEGMTVKMQVYTSSEMVMFIRVNGKKTLKMAGGS